MKPELASLIKGLKLKGLKPILGDEGVLTGAAVAARAAGVLEEECRQIDECY